MNMSIDRQQSRESRGGGGAAHLQRTDREDAGNRLREGAAEWGVGLLCAAHT